MAEQTQQQKEQEALANTLGQAPQDGEFAAGADVPAVLANNPVLRQRLEENIAIQTGGDPNAVYQANQGGSFTQPGFQSPTVVTAAPTEQRVTDEMRQVDAAQEFLASPEAQLPGVDMGQFQLSQPQTITQPNGLTTEQEQLFSKQQELSQNRYASVEESIRQSVEQTVREVATKQRQAKGATNVQLARMGALNVSSAGIQYVNDLTNTHNQQISDIRMQGEALIQEARNARDAADLQTLSLKVQAIQDNKRLIMEEQTNYLNNIQQMQEIVKFQRDSATATIDAMAAADLSAEQVPAGYLENLDRAAGYAQGTSAGLLAVAREARVAQNQAQEIELAQRLRTLLDGTPLGEQVVVDGITYYGTSRDNIEIDELGYAKRFITDDNGVVTVQDLGKVAAGAQPQFIQDGNGRPYLYDPQTRQLSYLPTNFGSGSLGNIDDASAIWQNTSFVDGAGKTVVLAEGTKFNWYDKRDGDSFGGECGEFIRWATDADDTGASGLSVGNSYESKLEKADRTIGTPENPVRVGDTFMHSTNSQYGHIGIVNSVVELDDGDFLLKFTEANVNLDGKVTHTRTMKLSELKARNGAFARYELRPELQFGSDNYTVPEFGEPDPTKKPAPKIEKINGRDVYWDANLGTWVPAEIETSPEKVQADNEKAERIKQLTSELLANPKIDKYTGPVESRIPRALWSTDKVDFYNKIGSLKSLLTLDNLKMMTGVLTDKDIQLLADAATSLSTEGSADAFTAELRRITGEISKPTRAPSSTTTSGSERMTVRKKDTGEIGTILPSEFDANLYEKL